VEEDLEESNKVKEKLEDLINENQTMKR